VHRAHAPAVAGTLGGDAMTTSATNPFAAPAARRSLRPLLLGAGVLVAVAALTAVAFAGLRFARPGALPGTTVNGVAVGGLQGEPLRTAVAGSGPADRVITIVRGPARWQATGTELGYVLDVDTTVERVLDRGRQANPFAAASDHLAAFRTTTAVPPAESVDEAVLMDALAEAAAVLGADPVEGSLAFAGATISRVEPVPGAVLDVEALAADVRTALLDEGPQALEAPVELVEPETTAEDVDAVLALAERAVSGPVALTRPQGAVTFTPDDIGGLLGVRRDGGDLGLEIDPADVAALVPTTTVAALRTEPRDAEVRLVGGAVEISESAEGFAFDPEQAAAQLLAVATADGPREVPLDGTVVAPALSTADAQGLGIVEQVSTFTTEHPCCQGRVTNIQRMADLVDGVLIRPGEVFSLNDHVGERTRAKGFVEGGAIQNGEFVDEVGGGVSQFTTTMFNAAFFGGYAIPDHKAHSYYISRYPAGREATLNFPTVDLKVENTSPHGILVATSYTDTSITVSFWGTRWVEVTESTGPRRNPTSPDVRTVDTPDLPAGATRLRSEGRPGFDITVSRTLRHPDGRVEREDFFTRYLPEPRVTERGTG
jgi:vancomycin resistance protein YoaR